MLQQGGIRMHLLTRNSLRSVCGSCATIASISPELSPGNKRANRRAIPDCLKGEGHHNTPPPLVTACRQKCEPHAATSLPWPPRAGRSFKGAFDHVLPTFRGVVEALGESKPVRISVSTRQCCRPTSHPIIRPLPSIRPLTSPLSRPTSTSGIRPRPSAFSDFVLRLRCHNCTQ